MKIHFVVFRIMTPCSDVRYQRFGGYCCLHFWGVVSGAWKWT